MTKNQELLSSSRPRLFVEHIVNHPQAVCMPADLVQSKEEMGE